jgi:hypothetical protein
MMKNFIHHLKSFAMKKKKGPETATDYHAEFSLQLAGKTPEQLTEIYNREVGGRGWNNARSVFLHELRCALSNLGIDFSCVQGTSGGFNLNRKVTLSDKRFVLLPRTTQEP